MRLLISPRVQEKLANKKPPVTRDEIVQCFANRTGVYLLDDREEHQTEPPTRWFIAETDFGRLLKICFMQHKGMIAIKSAFEPNEVEFRIYKKFGDHRT